MARYEDRRDREAREPKKIARFRWVLLGLVGAAFFAAVLVRFFANESGRPTGEAAVAARSSPPAGAGGTSFLPDGSRVPAPPPEEPTAREKAEEIAPVVTEASLFAFLGFATGYAARKIVKIGMVLVALFFAALQGLAYAGVLTVDFGKAAELVNQLVLNVGGGQNVAEILKHHVPSAGALAGGYLLGFRRG